VEVSVGIICFTEYLSIWTTGLTFCKRLDERFAMQPVLVTSRLILRPRNLADTEYCLAIDREPGVMRFLGGPRTDAAAHRAFVEARTVGPYAAGLGYWMVCRRETPGEALGWVLLIPNDAVGPEIEIGWRFRPLFWGQGFATEAARALLAHAFGTLGLAEVIAGIQPENAASIAVARKLGFAADVAREGPYQRFSLRR